MWGGDIDARSVFPLAVESSIIWTISRKMSSLLAVEGTDSCSGLAACSLGGGGVILPLWPLGNRSPSGPLFRIWDIFPAAVVAHLVVWVRGRPAWMKSSAASLLVFGLCFRTRRLTSSGMAFISCSFTKMSRMSVASVLSVPAFVQWSARLRNQTASFRGVSPALSLAARKCWRYVSLLMLYCRRIGTLRVSYTRAESAATAA